MEKKISVEEFVKQYKNLVNPIDFVKKHIVVDYIPYATKINSSLKILKATMFKTTEKQVEVFAINTPIQYQLYTMKLIDTYTDIEINYTDNEFDNLDKNHLIDMIIGNIDEREITKFNEVFEMCKKDLFENNRALPNYFDSIKLLIEKML